MAEQQGTAVVFGANAEGMGGGLRNREEALGGQVIATTRKGELDTTPFVVKHDIESIIEGIREVLSKAENPEMVFNAIASFGVDVKNNASEAALFVNATLSEIIARLIPDVTVAAFSYAPEFNSTDGEVVSLDAIYPLLYLKKALESVAKGEVNTLLTKEEQVIFCEKTGIPEGEKLEPIKNLVTFRLPEFDSPSSAAFPGKEYLILYRFLSEVVPQIEASQKDEFPNFRALFEELKSVPKFEEISEKLKDVFETGTFIEDAAKAKNLEEVQSLLETIIYEKGFIFESGFLKLFSQKISNLYKKLMPTLVLERMQEIRDNISGVIGEDFDHVIVLKPVDLLSVDKKPIEEKCDIGFFEKVDGETWKVPMDHERLGEHFSIAMGTDFLRLLYEEGIYNPETEGIKLRFGGTPLIPGDTFRFDSSPKGNGRKEQLMVNGKKNEGSHFEIYPKKESLPEELSVASENAQRYEEIGAVLPQRGNLDLAAKEVFTEKDGKKTVVCADLNLDPEKGQQNIKFPRICEAVEQTLGAMMIIDSGKPNVGLASLTIDVIEQAEFSPAEKLSIRCLVGPIKEKTGSASSKYQVFKKGVDGSEEMVISGTVLGMVL